MFINDIISKLQKARTLSEINDILIIAKDNINGLSLKEVAKIEAEATEQKQKLYNKNYIQVDID